MILLNQKTLMIALPWTCFKICYWKKIASFSSRTLWCQENPGFRSRILSCCEALSKPGDDTSLWKSLFHFHGHFLGSDSQCQSNRGVRAAELSWEQTTSTPELDIQGPARAAGAGWLAPALLASSLCIQFLFPTSQCWHQVEFPQQCSWEMAKISDVSWLETRLHLIFSRLQLIPWRSKGTYLSRG